VQEVFGFVKKTIRIEAEAARRKLEGTPADMERSCPLIAVAG
jgi:hypothetical protein